jgi:hypothetical protein
VTTEKICLVRIDQILLAVHIHTNKETALILKAPICIFPASRHASRIPFLAVQRLCPLSQYQQKSYFIICDGPTDALQTNESQATFRDSDRVSLERKAINVNVNAQKKSMPTSIS